MTELLDNATKKFEGKERADLFGTSAKGGGALTGGLAGKLGAALVQRVEEDYDEKMQDLFRKQQELEDLDDARDSADEAQDDENEQDEDDLEEEKVNAMFDQIQNDQEGEDDMLKSMKVKNAIKKDPFLKYGTGIKNYFMLQT